MRSQGHRHTSRPTLPAIAREEPRAYDTGPAARPGGSGADDVAGAVATILADDERSARLPEGAELADLAATLRAMDRLAARAVQLAGWLDGRRAAAEEGMSVDGALRLHTALAGPDLAMVLTAADVLAQMPATAALFARGVLSWGHVRQLVVGVRRFDRPTRHALDIHLGEHAARLERLDGEQLGWALEDAIDDHRAERDLEQRAERQQRSEFLSLQGRLDGSGQLYADYGPEAFATITERLTTEADTPRARPCPGDSDGPNEPAPTRGQQLADALLRICTTGRDGRAGTPVRFTVLVDVDRVTDRAAGTIQHAVRGRPPRIVRRTLDRLSCDAALDVVIRDGTDLLAAHRYTPDITAPTRRAVTARDAGCRFPACTAPASWCDIHHLTPRAQEQHPDAIDGDHHPTNLVLLCRRHHTLVHRRGWHQTLHPDGTYTIRRHGRTWTTSPRHTQLPPPHPRPEPQRTRAGPTHTRPRAGPDRRPHAGPEAGPIPDRTSDPPRAVDPDHPTQHHRPPGPPLPF